MTELRKKFGHFKMTKQEIRDEAPSGATHYDKFGDYYLLDSGFLVWSKTKNDFVFYCSYREGLDLKFKPL